MSSMLGQFEAVQQFLASGGFVMIPLAISTLVLWYCLGWRLFVLRRGTRGTIVELIQKHQSSIEFPALWRDTTLLQAIRVGASTSKKYSKVQDISPFLEGAISPLLTKLERFSLLIRLIVMTSPLLGLLGTVTGMIETFDALSQMALFTQSGGIAGGISQALISTEMGLAVAIPGLILGRLLDRKQQRTEEELDEIIAVLAFQHQQQHALEGQ